MSQAERVEIITGVSPLEFYDERGNLEAQFNGVGVAVKVDGLVIWEQREYLFRTIPLRFGLKLRKGGLDKRVLKARNKAERIAQNLKRAF